MQPSGSPTDTLDQRYPSAVNLRDVGGLRTTDGRRVRTGKLLRSGSPQFLSADDAQALTASDGVRLVLDLRYDAEARAEGHGELANTGVRIVNVPIVGAGGARVEMDVLAGALANHAGEPDHLAPHYISYAQLNPGAFVTAIALLAEPDGLPALVHCAAGKDRTGVLVALVLSLLDVTADAIVADYARTAENLADIVGRLSTAPTYATTIGQRPLDDPFAQSPPESMRRFLAWVATEHGSAEQLLLSAGLDPAVPDLLRSRLVAPPAA